MHGTSAVITSSPLLLFLFSSTSRVHFSRQRRRNCPNCKALRKATKRLSLTRLPPVLLIHLKRFSVKGHFTEKIESTIDFPLKSLDLTNYMPSPLPPGVSQTQSFSADDPRAQSPPYRYDLYGVTNHFGTLSSGHCEWIVAAVEWDDR